MNKVFCAIVLILSLLSCSRKTTENIDIILPDQAAVQQTIDLQGATKTMPPNSTITELTKYKNGTIIGNNTRIEAGIVQLFDEVILQGTWQNDTFPLAWTTANTHPEKNWSALLQILYLGKIVLLDQLYPIATPGRWALMDFSGDIRIIGINADYCGLILHTVHTGNNAYFNHIRGNNLMLHNISLNTRQSIIGEEPSADAYRLVSCSNNSLIPDANPDIDYIDIQNCRINGHISLRYNGNTKDPQLTTKGIKKINISYNQLYETANFFALSNACYQEVILSNNKILENKGISFAFGIAGTGFDHEEISKNRKILYFENNTVLNTSAIHPLDKNYLAPIIAKGFDFIVKNNRIENQLTLNPEVEAYAFYCSASNLLHAEGNFSRNCGGISTSQKANTSSLLKLKGAINAVINNNEFVFDVDGLGLLGLLKPGQALSGVDASTFKFCIFDHWKIPGLDSTSYLKIEANTFRSAILSDFSYLFNANVSIINNRFLIDHFLEAPADNWSQQSVRLPFTFFYLRNPVKNGVLEFKGNRFDVGSSSGNQFYLTHNLNDDKSFEKVVYQGNIFNMPGTMGLDILRAEEFISENVSEGSTSLVFRHPTTLRQNAFTRKQSVNEKMQSIRQGREGLINIRSLGKVIVKAEKQTTDAITLMNIRFPDYNFYESADSLPVSVHLKISYIKNNKIEQHVYHLVIDKANLCYHKGQSGSMVSSPMIWSNNRPHFRHQVWPLKSTLVNDIRIFWSSQLGDFSSHHNGFLVLEGLMNAKEIEIQAEVLPTPVSNRAAATAKQEAASRTIFGL